MPCSYLQGRGPQITKALASRPGCQVHANCREIQKTLFGRGKLYGDAIRPYAAGPWAARIRPYCLGFGSCKTKGAWPEPSAQSLSRPCRVVRLLGDHEAAVFDFDDFVSLEARLFTAVQDNGAAFQAKIISGLVGCDDNLVGHGFVAALSDLQTLLVRVPVGQGQGQCRARKKQSGTGG